MADPAERVVRPIAQAVVQSSVLGVFASVDHAVCVDVLIAIVGWRTWLGAATAWGDSVTVVGSCS